MVVSEALITIPHATDVRVYKKMAILFIWLLLMIEYSS